MTHGQLKGALLEYIIRRLLQNCGFISVNPDGHYIYEQNGTGLFYINGKGAAHDADVLMEPPIQLPFSYPSRILFECKAYKRKIGLGVVRNVLGLRYDINEFEIVTDESIQQRKNNRRSNYAISDRKRFNYQVGVASTEHFSSSAIEFAANNKIPLLSLRWFLSDEVCDLFHQINSEYMDSLDQLSVKEALYKYLKKKRSFRIIPRVRELIEKDPIIGRIIREFNLVIDRSFVGLIETGDLIFLFASQGESLYIREQMLFEALQARIHYYTDQPNKWILELLDGRNEINPQFTFFVPDRIMRMWQEYSFDKSEAINLKERYFSRIFIFTNHEDRRRLPFISVNIDENWLRGLREQ